MTFYQTIKNNAINLGLGVLAISLFGNTALPSNIEAAQKNYNPTRLEQTHGLEQYIQKHGKVTFEMIEKDAARLNSLGYDTSKRELFYLTRIVSDEAGNYYTCKKNNSSKKNNSLKKYDSSKKNSLQILELTKENEKLMTEDMEGIIHNILNRYLAAKYDKDKKRVLKTSFSGNREVSFYSILFRNGQYSATDIMLWAQSRDNAYKKRELTYNEPRLTIEHTDQNLRDLNRNKILLAYRTLVKTLERVAKDPYWDPTGGSLFYKKVEWNKKWHEEQFGQYTKRFIKQISKHNHYGLFDDEVRPLKFRDKLKLEFAKKDKKRLKERVR